MYEIYYSGCLYVFLNGFKSAFQFVMLLAVVFVSFYKHKCKVQATEQLELQICFILIII